MAIKGVLLVAGIALLTYKLLHGCGWCSGDSKETLERLRKPQWWGPGTEPPADKQDTSIRPIKISVPEATLQDLNRRLDATRLPAGALEGIHFQYGFNPDTLAKLVRHWRHEYKWREREALFNRYPHFKTRIQGLDLHFLHVKPPGDGKTVPLLLLHGWPGSVREFYTLMELLTAPGEVQFELVVPSLPGYGWSESAARPGLGTAQTAQLMGALMQRLGHDTWYVQGGDWGSQIASHMSLLFPERVLGLHINMCVSNMFKSNALTALASLWPSMFMEERFIARTYPMWEKFKGKLLETGYLHIQATKPDTVGAGLADSPAGLAAYILEKFSTGTNNTYRDMQDGGLNQKFTYDDLLDNVMVYWLTNSMTTAMRLYAEHFSNAHRALGLDALQVKVPTWCARFPGEIYYQPDWILRHRYPQLVGASDMPLGGHFAAMEVPELLAQDIREAIKRFQQH